LKKITFVVGGCRSGKSRHAQNLAEAAARTRRIYIATCIPYDDEMKDRIIRHQNDRDRSWHTVEAPVALPEAVADAGKTANVVLVDCLTLWTTNLLLTPETSDRIDRYVRDLTDALDDASCPLILVSNEVGAGIVPENPLARRFRDVMGIVNQRVAACADEVVWTVAGIPVIIKKAESAMP
jgi:adenosylcobinamide kinase/adenosylcobinamide-phosphate guanylyltransferase